MIWNIFNIPWLSLVVKKPYVYILKISFCTQSCIFLLLIANELIYVHTLQITGFLKLEWLEHIIKINKRNTLINIRVYIELTDGASLCQRK